MIDDGDVGKMVAHKELDFVTIHNISNSKSWRFEMKKISSIACY